MDPIPYWITFVNPPEGTALTFGCGVTARSYEDVLAIIAEKVTAKHPGLQLDCVTENVEVEMLDGDNVLPHIGSTVEEGVWFPKGY